MSGMNGNSDMAPMYCTVPNMPKRSHPVGCNVTNPQVANTAQNQLYSLTNSNLQAPVAGCLQPQQIYPMSNQPVVTGPQMCPVQNQQSVYTGNGVPQVYSPNISNTYNPFLSNPQYCVAANTSLVNPHSVMQQPYNNSQTIGPPSLFALNVSSPAYNPPPVSPWNVNPWNNPTFTYTNVCPSPLLPLSSPLPLLPYPRIPSTNRPPTLATICHSAPPKPLGKLLFPTIYEFKHGSFFKMLIHMSGFEAKNITISANKNCIQLRAVKEEIEKQVEDFSGYILKQVERVYYLPEVIEESKIQISINEDVIGILIPWKQNSC